MEVTGRVTPNPNDGSHHLAQAVGQAGAGAHDAIDKVSEAARPVVDRIASRAHRAVDRIAGAAGQAAESSDFSVVIAGPGGRFQPAVSR